MRRAVIISLSLLLWISDEAKAQNNRRVAATDLPKVFVLDAGHLKSMRQRVRNGDTALGAPLSKLESEARKALSSGTFSVVLKDANPPSGDKHDYMSQAPYFWPDPKSANGLPYIRRDGERNPEINQLPDHESMNRMSSSVHTLALAWYLKGDEAFAVKAAALLRAWFLDPATRMNPNFQYAQAIPGITTGRGIGLIESRVLTQVVDATGLLAGSRAWTAADQRGLEEWFGKFLQWMLESKNGRDEMAAQNNHGTYYDLQTASFALFIGKKELAVSILEGVRENRIAKQIEPDGRQPLELARTRAWSYSVGNLDGLMSLARLGENVGVDLWSYSSADGRSIRRALDCLLPFALGDREWPHQQLGEWPPQMLFPLIRRAALKYKDSNLEAALARIPRVTPDDRSALLQPGMKKGGEKK